MLPDDFTPPGPIEGPDGPIEGPDGPIEEPGGPIEEPGGPMELPPTICSSWAKLLEGPVEEGAENPEEEEEGPARSGVLEVGGMGDPEGGVGVGLRGDI